jgi:hypothetical protein
MHEEPAAGSALDSMTLLSRRSPSNDVDGFGEKLPGRDLIARITVVTPCQCGI